MDPKKLNYLERPLVTGQNNYAPYRPLAYFYPLYKITESLLDIPNTLKTLHFKDPLIVNMTRNAYFFEELNNFLFKYMPKETLEQKLSYYFSKEFSYKISLLRYGYVLFDIYNRNKKFNKEQPKFYKCMYSLDLALWHSMATFVFPIMAAETSLSIFRRLAGLSKNKNFYWNLFSLFAAFYGFVYCVKIGDSVADVVMNNTYRRFVFDYKVDEINEFTVEFNKLKQLDNAKY